MRYQNIGSMFFRFVTKNACDGRTDKENYDPQDRASIAASRGKMHHNTALMLFNVTLILMMMTNQRL